MKKLIRSVLTIGFLASGSLNTYGQAEIQIIHNAADPSADTVDIYVNGTIALNDFAFRTATPFIQLPSGTLINIGVAPGNSSSVNNTIKNFQANLMMGQRYVAIANGVLDPSNFAVNPDGSSTAFFVYS